MIEAIGVGVVLVAPALLFLGWLTLVGLLVGALGSSSDGELDESRLLRPRTRPS